MDVSGLGVKSELQLLAYATATAMPDLSHICDPHRNLCNTRPLTHWAKPGTEIISSWTLCQVLNLLSHNGNSSTEFQLVDHPLLHTQPFHTVHYLQSFQEKLVNNILSIWLKIIYRIFFNNRFLKESIGSFLKNQFPSYLCVPKSQW